jgi:hypothetical protein
MPDNNPDISEPTVTSLQAEIQYLERELLALTIRLFHLEHHAIQSNEYSPPDYAQFSFEADLKN